FTRSRPAGSVALPPGSSSSLSGGTTTVISPPSSRVLIGRGNPSSRLRVPPAWSPGSSGDQDPFSVTENGWRGERGPSPPFVAVPGETPPGVEPIDRSAAPGRYNRNSTTRVTGSKRTWLTLSGSLPSSSV